MRTQHFRSVAVKKISVLPLFYVFLPKDGCLDLINAMKRVSRVPLHVNKESKNDNNNHYYSHDDNDDNIDERMKGWWLSNHNLIFSMSLFL